MCANQKSHIRAIEVMDVKPSPVMKSSSHAINVHDIIQVSVEFWCCTTVHITRTMLIAANVAISIIFAIGCSPTPYMGSGSLKSYPNRFLACMHTVSLGNVPMDVRGRHDFSMQGLPEMRWEFGLIFDAKEDLYRQDAPDGRVRIALFTNQHKIFDREDDLRDWRRSGGPGEWFLSFSGLIAEIPLGSGKTRVMSLNHGPEQVWGSSLLVSTHQPYRLTVEVTIPSTRDPKSAAVVGLGGGCK